MSRLSWGSVAVGVIAALVILWLMRSRRKTAA